MRREISDEEEYGIFPVSVEETLARKRYDEFEQFVQIREPSEVRQLRGELAVEERESLELAIMVAIALGNRPLKREFPELAHADPDHARS